jgi:O-antigen ligase
MSSVAKFEIAIPKRRVTRVAFTPLPLWQLAVGWVLLVPMLYFAMMGTLVPRTTDISYAATGDNPATSASHKINVALLCLLCMILIAFRFSSVLALSLRLKMMLAFPVLAILSGAWSTDPLQSVISGVILLVFTLFAIYVGSRFPFQRQFELVMLMGAIVLPASVLVALFIPSIGTDGAHWRGILAHKQNCAAVVMFCLITALHWECSGIFQKIFRAVYMVLCVVLIVMSQSRTGWFLTVVALLLSGTIWLLQKMPAQQALAMLLIGVLVVAGATYGIRAHSVTLLDSVGKDSTLSQRTSIWASVWGAIMRRPILGYGFGAFWRGLYGPSQGIVLDAGWGLSQAQDGFLDVWLGMGVPGVALLGLMTLQAIRNAFRCFYWQENQAYVRWCIVVVLITLLFNIGESTIGKLQTVWFLFLLACIGLEQSVSKVRSSLHTRYEA